MGTDVLLGLIKGVLVGAGPRVSISSPRASTCRCDLQSTLCLNTCFSSSRASTCSTQWQHTHTKRTDHTGTYHTHTHDQHTQERRPHDVRLIVMSATLDASKFISYFPGCKGCLIHGRAFPVQLQYTAKPEDNYLDAALNATLQVRVCLCMCVSHLS